MTSRLNEIQKHDGTAIKVPKWQTCSNEKSKRKNIGWETTRRESEIVRGQGTQREDKGNIRTGKMKGNKWQEKPAQNKASRKNLQLLVKYCSLGSLNNLNRQRLSYLISRGSKLLEQAKDEVL